MERLSIRYSGAEISSRNQAFPWLFTSFEPGRGFIGFFALAAPPIEWVERGRNVAAASQARIDHGLSNLLRFVSRSENRINGCDPGHDALRPRI